jgi:hypothetical protein
MGMTTMPRTRRLGAALFCAALVVAGCSSDDDAGDTGADATTTTAAGASSTTAGDGPDQPDQGGGQPLDRYADYETATYDDPARWVCRPDTDDLCDGDLTATVVAADGTLTEEPFEPAADPPIDCFYVYPTISRDTTSYSDWEASDDEEGFVTLNQAARLQSRCRLFAPVYRQRTLTALTAGMTGGDAPGGETLDPFADVLDAFRTYMANDNGGRGVVLIGHSQGSAMLSQLIAEEIDPNDDVREVLVAAYLAGWSVSVPEGADVGGQFQNVPVCRADDQTGCVISWASFRATAPPPASSFFGRPVAGSRSADAEQPDGQTAVCANPADLAAGVGGEPVEVQGYFPSNRTASILGDLGVSTEGEGWLDPAAGDVTTPYVTVPGLVRARCVSDGGFTYLSVEVQADPGDPRADDIPGDLTPEWGLHLVDVNLVMGDVVELVGLQAEAYAG